MNSFPVVQKIPFAEIDFSDRLFFLYHLRENDTDTKQGISTDWITLQETKSNQYRIIDGFKTLEYLKNNNISHCQALIFSSEHNILELWTKRVLKRHYEKNLSLVDFLEKLHKILIFTNQKFENFIIQNILSNLHIPKYQLSLQLLQQINEKANYFEAFTELHNLDFRLLRNLTYFSTENLNYIAIMLNGLKLKGNKMFSLLELLIDLEKGFELSPKVLCNNELMQNIRENSTGNQRYKEIKQLLVELRYPQRKDLCNQWDNLLEQVNLPPGIGLKHDQNFERDTIEIALEISSLTELKSSIHNLNLLIKNKYFQELLKII